MVSSAERFSLDLAVLSRAEASIISGGSDIPDSSNAATASCSTSGNSCSVSKTFGSTDPINWYIGVIFTVDAPGQYDLVESIGNQSGITWSDFHWAIFPVSEVVGLTLSGVSDYGPFTTVSGAGTNMLTVAGGTLASSASFSPTVTVDVPDDAFQNLESVGFIVYQTPSIETPEPSTLALLGLGVAGLGAASRRRRAA